MSWLRRYRRLAASQREPEVELMVIWRQEVELRVDGGRLGGTEKAAMYRVRPEVMQRRSPAHDGHAGFR